MLSLLCNCAAWFCLPSRPPTVAAVPYCVAQHPSIPSPLNIPAAGAAPLEYGYLAPLLPGASAQAVVVRQSGCDAGTHSGLANTVTWNLMEVDPAVLTTLVSHVSEIVCMCMHKRGRGGGIRPGMVHVL